MKNTHKNRAPKPYFFYICFAISIIFVLFFYLLSFFNLIQDQQSINLIGTASRWCERISDNVFREPINTISNIGFMAIGLYLAYVISNDKHKNNINHFTGINSISIIYVIAVIFLGPGAMLMHGTNTEWGNWVDNLSMIMFIVIPWLYNILLLSLIHISEPTRPY